MYSYFYHKMIKKTILERSECQYGLPLSKDDVNEDGKF